MQRNGKADASGAEHLRLLHLTLFYAVDHFSTVTSAIRRTLHL